MLRRPVAGLGPVTSALHLRGFSRLYTEVALFATHRLSSPLIAVLYRLLHPSPLFSGGGRSLACSPSSCYPLRLQLPVEAATVVAFHNQRHVDPKVSSSAYKLLTLSVVVN